MMTWEKIFSGKENFWLCLEGFNYFSFTFHVCDGENERMIEDAFSLTHSSRELWRREKVLGIISSQWIIDEKEFRPSTHKLQYIYFPIYDNLLEERIFRTRTN